MSNDVAIRIEGLGKRYRLGQSANLTRTFRETLMTLPRHLLGRPKAQAPAAAPAAPAAPRDPDTPPGTFWALRDVSFDVPRGEVIGIIGRNGAGKSTLLKILSRITMPTAGRAELRGRLASLLEVGTGFHPELTGRENIFLNGAILGMRRAEIAAKFDEIVAFAEIEKFLDTPVKRYSSGMYVRLAFAVAAHLEPEILIVDEVLAVGDLAFQAKCTAKMQDVAKSERTILFVSHNMNAVRQLCTRAVWLVDGRIHRMGDTDEVVSAYQEEGLRAQQIGSGRFRRDPRDRPKRATWVAAAELLDAEGKPASALRCGDSLRLVVHLEGSPPRPGTSVTWILSDGRGAPIAWSNSVMTRGFGLTGASSTAVCDIPSLPLAIGRYSLSLSSGILGSQEPKDIWRDAAGFQIIACDPYGTKVDLSAEPFGAVVIDHTWSEA